MNTYMNDVPLDFYLWACIEAVKEERAAAELAEHAEELAREIDWEADTLAC